MNMDLKQNTKKDKLLIKVDFIKTVLNYEVN